METGGRVGGTCFGPAPPCDWRHVGGRERCKGDRCTLQMRSERKKRADILVPLAAASSAMVFISQFENILGLSNGETVKRSGGKSCSTSPRRATILLISACRFCLSCGRVERTTSSRGCASVFWMVTTSSCISNSCWVRASSCGSIPQKGSISSNISSYSSGS